MFQNRQERRFSGIVFAVYFFLLIWLILFKFQIHPEDIPHMRSLNLIPLQGTAIVNGKRDFDEVFYNILVFVPLGFYTAIYRNRYSFLSQVLPVFLLSFALESIQYIFAIGASDITDLIANTLGGILGIFGFSLFRTLFKDKSVRVVNMIGLLTEIMVFVMAGILFAVNR